MYRNARAALIALQLTGVILSALLVAVTFANPQQVEQRLQGFAIAKVEKAADVAWEASSKQLSTGGRAEKLGDLAQRFGLKADTIDAQREQIVPALLAYALSDRCGENCGFAAIAGLAANSALIERASQFRVGQGTLRDFIVERYDTTVRGLITDLRRFGIVNIVVLSLAIGLVVFRNYLNWRFAAFSAAVTGYTAWAAYGYVFNQNWALSILLQDWSAPGYQIAMILVSCLFFDWLFLRGWITQLIGNAIAVAIGG